jgi:hypothetical protein
MLKGPYRFHLQRNNPFEAVQKFLDLRRPLFNFSQWAVQKTGENGLKVRILDFGEWDTGVELFLLLLGACFQGLVEHNGGKQVKLQTREEGASADKTLIFDLQWS